MTKDTVSNPYIIPINLRDHWGSRRATEILDRHFSDLGLDAKNFIKTYEKSNIIYLLDGLMKLGRNPGVVILVKCNISEKSQSVH